MGLLEWLHRRHRRHRREPTRGGCPAQFAAEAEQRRREAYDRWSIVNEVASKLDQQGERNHFGEVLDATFRPRRA